MLTKVTTIFNICLHFLNLILLIGVDRAVVEVTDQQAQPVQQNQQTAQQSRTRNQQQERNQTGARNQPGNQNESEQRDDPNNEIKRYAMARYISTNNAIWRYVYLSFDKFFCL